MSEITDTYQKSLFAALEGSGKKYDFEKIQAA